MQNNIISHLNEKDCTEIRTYFHFRCKFCTLVITS